MSVQHDRDIAAGIRRRYAAKVFKVRDRVRGKREAPAKSGWHLYAGREGIVTTVNRRDGEIGVEFGVEHRTTWFLPSELVLVRRQTAQDAARALREGEP